MVDLPETIVRFEMAVKKNGPRFMTHLQKVGGGAPPDLALVAFPGGGDGGADSATIVGMFLGTQGNLTTALTAAGLGTEALAAQNLSATVNPIKTMPFQDFVVSEACE